LLVVSAFFGTPIFVVLLDFEQPPDKGLGDLTDEAAMPDGWGDPLRREWAAGEE
jgi:hypothetical protein